MREDVYCHLRITRHSLHNDITKQCFPFHGIIQAFEMFYFTKMLYVIDLSFKKARAVYDF